MSNEEYTFHENNYIEGKGGQRVWDEHRISNIPSIVLVVLSLSQTLQNIKVSIFFIKMK